MKIIKNKKHRPKSRCLLEAPPRLELGNRGFAVRCLTTWLWRLIQDFRTICPEIFFGAAYEARTRYLHLGKVALYQMSYIRTKVATRNGLEPSTSSVTG